MTTVAALQRTLVGQPVFRPNSWRFSRRQLFRQNTPSAPTGATNRLPSRATMSTDTSASQEGLDAFEELLMGSGRVTTVAHKIWANLIKPGDTVVDGTCGNGNDTLFLAQLALSSGEPGRVVGFDVQETAIAATRQKLQSELGLQSSQLLRVELHKQCHSCMSDHLHPEQARLVCFNLGYLPGGDKTVITQTQTTLQAIRAAAEITMPGGLLSIIGYIGHDGGQDEFGAVLDFARQLNSKRWTVTMSDVLNRNNSPVLLSCYKKL